MANQLKAWAQRRPTTVRGYNAEGILPRAAKFFQEHASDCVLKQSDSIIACIILIAEVEVERLNSL